MARLVDLTRCAALCEPRIGEPRTLEGHKLADLSPPCLCPVCGKLGDDRTMVKVGPMRSPAHDRCAFAQLGEGILNLPKDERAKFTLAAVGPDMMRRLVEAGERP